MWAFTMVHELPYDDPERAAAPAADPLPDRRSTARSGSAELPNVRLQRAFAAPGSVTALDRLLSVVHWVWFIEPHAVAALRPARHPDRFPRAARQLAAIYDLGCAVYFAVPTAPPWWSAEQGYIDPPVEHVAAEVAEAEAIEVRRIMVDAGEEVWRPAWEPLYDRVRRQPVGGDALASLRHLADGGDPPAPRRDGSPGALGWGYAVTLGFALVYLGEHYVTDLIAGRRAGRARSARRAARRARGRGREPRPAPPRAGRQRRPERARRRIDRRACEDEPGCGARSDRSGQGG